MEASEEEVSSEAVMHVLTRHHEPEAYERLHVELTAERAVRSLDDLRPLARKVGLNLTATTDVDQYLDLPEGGKTTLFKLLLDVFGGFMIEGDGLRIMTEDEAVRAWRDRLAPKR